MAKINTDPHQLIVDKVKNIKEFSYELSDTNHIKRLNKMADEILKILDETEVYIKSNDPFER